MLFSRIYRLIFLLYRYGISPAIHLISGSGFGCRFHPSCSEYADEAIRVYGLRKGGFMALRRLARCHPFSQAPLHDPVISTVKK